MDFEEFIYLMKRNRLGKNALKIILTGCLGLVILIIVFFVIAILAAFNYHEQIYEVISRIINFVFGDSPNNALRGFFQQYIDGALKNQFNE